MYGSNYVFRPSRHSYVSLPPPQEASSKILTLAHLYTLDHVIQTLYTLHFGFAYWSSPHDGRSVINSQAQKDMIDLAISRGEVAADREGGEALALGLWKQERGTAALVLVAASLIKVRDNV